MRIVGYESPRRTAIEIEWKKPHNCHITKKEKK